MPISIFLAKLIGLYLLISALICIFRKQRILRTGKEFASSASALAVSAEFSLVFGLVIVIDHSVWELSWRVLITIMGYLLILRGIMRFAFPDLVRKLADKITNRGFWLTCIIMLILGVYLTYCGFAYHA